MNDKKHIDRLFQEKFKNFEATPDDAVWENIHNELHGEKRKRRVVPFWWRSTGVAALLLLFFTVGYFMLMEDIAINPTEIQTVGTEAEQKSVDPKSDKNIHQKYDSNFNTSPEKSLVQESVTSEEKEPVNQNNFEKTQNPSTWASKKLSDINNDKSAQKQKDAAYETKTNAHRMVNNADDPLDPSEAVQNKSKAIISQTADDNQHLANTNDSGKNFNLEHTNIDKGNVDDGKVVTPMGESIEDAIAKSKQESEIQEAHSEEEKTRWNITPNVAPVYFNSLGKGSSIHSQFVNNGKSSDINMSYGISGSYALNDKIKIRAGINKVELGYSTAGVIGFSDMHSFNANAKSAQLSNITFNKKAENDAFLSLSNINSESAPQFVMSTTEGSLEQQFGYIEVPLEIEYNLIDTKLGLNLIGGFSTLFLNNNQIYSVMNQERVLLGEANNINSTSYSANLGIGFNYNISNSLKLNLEPMFKYQLNTFTNTSGDFRPFFIGVYSGFSFKF